MRRWQAARKRTSGLLLIILIGGASVSTRTPPVETGVQVVANEAARRIDVMVDGKPFTAYSWPESIKKPVLFPLRTAQGAIVTRGYPLEPRPGERIDHPHQ